MPVYSSFAERFARLRAGVQDDDTLRLNQYVKRLLVLAHSQLYEQTKAKVDAEDVVQSVLLSFHTRHAGQVDLQAEDGLWDKLAEITLRHCNKWNKRRQRDRAKIVPLQPSTDGPDTGFEPADDKPSPQEAAELADLVKWLMQALGTDREREVLTLRLQGYTILEICKRLHLSEQTVNRALKTVKERVNERLEVMRAKE
jgi:RNA polymerase sigma factor (sigma-70 family)